MKGCQSEVDSDVRYTDDKNAAVSTIYRKLNSDTDGLPQFSYDTIDFVSDKYEKKFDSSVSIVTRLIASGGDSVQGLGGRGRSARQRR